MFTIRTLCLFLAALAFSACGDGVGASGDNNGTACSSDDSSSADATTASDVPPAGWPWRCEEDAPKAGQVQNFSCVYTRPGEETNDTYSLTSMQFADPKLPAYYQLQDEEGPHTTQFPCAHFQTTPRGFLLSNSMAVDGTAHTWDCTWLNPPNQ